MTGKKEKKRKLKDRVLYLTTDLTTRNIRGQKKNIFSVLNNTRGQPKILYPVKTSFKDEGKIMISLDKSWTLPSLDPC